jgi:hypothetical protein
MGDRLLGPAGVKVGRSTEHAKQESAKSVDG